MRLTHDLLDQTKIDRSESIDLILTSKRLLCSNSIYRIDARSTTKTHLPCHSGEPELHNDIASMIAYSYYRTSISLSCIAAPIQPAIPQIGHE